MQHTQPLACCKTPLYQKAMIQRRSALLKCLPRSTEKNIFRHPIYCPGPIDCSTSEVDQLAKQRRRMSTDAFSIAYIQLYNAQCSKRTKPETMFALELFHAPSIDHKSSTPNRAHQPAHLPFFHCNKLPQPQRLNKNYG